MEHRDWCENEMSANEKAREDRTSSVETLKTQVRPVSSLLYSFIRFDHGPRIQALPAQDSKAFGQGVLKIGCETRGSQEQPAAPTIPWKVDSAESLVAKLGAEITELESQLSENQERLRGRRVRDL